MNAVVFLLIALAVFVVGCGLLWYKHRSPTTLDSSIRAFQRERDALAPRDDPGSDGADGPR